MTLSPEDHSKNPVNVAVVGAGKMGLPLAAQLASNGANVIAVDVNKDLVEKINTAECPFDEPGLPELLTKVVIDRKKLSATTELEAAVQKSNTIIVIVPVLVTDEKQADLTIMNDVTDKIASNIQKDSLVVYETTLPVGTSRKLFETISKKSGFKIGEDMFGAFSPERVKSLHVLENLTKNPKIVGGATETCSSIAEVFYNKYLGAEVINLQTLEASEFAKLADMVYRDVNIGLAIELSRYCEALGIDFESVRQAANTSGEAYLLIPGIGVGGHCTPVYPHFLINHAEEIAVPQKITRTSREINAAQPAHAVCEIEKSIGDLKNKRVLILGLGFRPGVKEHICSPAFDLKTELDNRSCDVYLHDPYYSEDEIEKHGFLPSIKLEGFDVIILNTAHNEYRNLGEDDFERLAGSGTKLIFDGRNIWEKDSVKKAGLTYLGIGNR